MKKEQHQRSVETLDLSVHGDALIIAEIQQLLATYQQQEIYMRNVLLRIQDLVNNYLNQGDK